MNLPDGLIAVVKKDCPTCLLVEPVLQAIDQGDLALTVFVQDEPGFPDVSHVIDDSALEHSFNLNIEIVPTLIRIENGQEQQRTIGWAREEWRALTGIEALAEDLPPYRPGCGSLSVAAGIEAKLAVQFGTFEVQSRSIEIGALEDDIDYCFEQGWSDGLPVVPPTKERLYRMLQGTRRSSNEHLGDMAPNGVPCTIEKVAVNAVMAGCKPEYLPVVIAAIEAILEPAYCMHGLLATTWFSGPMVIVNGPIRKAIGMNWQGNVLGQGNRANATIGRALQLVVRNVGGGRPQEIDQSTFGSPVKFGFCFAEDEDTPWLTLAEERGFKAEQSTVTVLTADGVQGVVDQRARDPEALIYSLAQSLRTVNHVDMVNASDAVVVIGPEHGRIFDQANWTKAQTVSALHAALQVRGIDLGMNTDESEEPNSNSADKKTLAKFRPEGLTLIRAGGQAGLFSAIIPGWVMKGPLGSDPVTKEVIV